MISKLQYITDDVPGKSHAQLAIEAIDGGVNWVQFRTKKLTGIDLLREAVEVKKVCAEKSAIFIINDHVSLTREINADGVHIGKQDIPLADARKILGPDYIIGGTANTFEDIVNLQKQNADYIGLGPFRFTETKKNLSPVLGIDGYKKIIDLCRKNKIDIPVIAIGGIRVEDVAEIMETGVYGIAISSAITMSTNKPGIIQNYKQLLIK